MVLLIIIPFLNGYFIGNIPNIFRQTLIDVHGNFSEMISVDETEDTDIDSDVLAGIPIGGAPSYRCQVKSKDPPS